MKSRNKHNKRRRKNHYQEKVNTLGFKICSNYGSTSSNMGLELPVEINIDERGKLEAHKRAQGKLKELNKQVHQKLQKPPYNMPKGETTETGLFIKEIVRRTSRLTGTRYGKKFIQRHTGI